MSMFSVYSHVPSKVADSNLKPLDFVVNDAKKLEQLLYIYFHPFRPHCQQAN